MEDRFTHRFDERPEERHGVLAGHATTAYVTGAGHQGQQVVGFVGQRQPHHGRQYFGDAVGQRDRGTEVEHHHPAVISQQKIPGMGIPVHHARAGRGTELELGEQLTGQVAFLRRPVGRDPGQRAAVGPFGDQHLGGGGQHVRHPDQRVVAIRGGEDALGVRLGPVVEFADGALVQFVDHALDIGPGVQRLEKRRESSELPEVGTQSLVRARVLDLDGDLATV